MNPASVLGFAMAAGKLASGDGASERAVRRGSVHLLLLAEDVGNATKRRFLHIAAERKVPLVQWGRKVELGQWIGERPRAVIAICDPQFARMLQDAVSGSGKQLR